MAQAEIKGRKRSERTWLDANREEADDKMEVAGVSYQILPAKDLKKGREWHEDFTLELMFDELPEAAVHALAAFGALTWLGNITNTVRNYKDGDVPPGATAQQEALTSAVEELKKGNWTSGRGDFEAGLPSLIEAYCDAIEKKTGTRPDGEEKLARLREMDKETRTTKVSEIKNHPDVKAALSARKAARDAERAAAASATAAPLSDF